MKNWLGSRIRIALAVVVVAVVVAVWLWHGKRGVALSFRTVPLKRGDVATTISATGTIEPVEVVDIGAQVAGRIDSFGKDVDGKTIDYGSVVDRGALLAKIDDSVYAADLAVANAQLELDKATELGAKANLDQMKAKFIQAEAEWTRGEELKHAKLISNSDYDTYKANYEVSKSNVAAAEAAISQAQANSVQAKALLDKAQRNLDFCTIRSPVKGVVIDRRVNIGQTVVASLNAPSLFLIARDLTKMQIWAAVNEADVGRIHPGAPVTFSCDAFPGHQFAGSVGKVRLNATMTQNVVMYTVEVNTENTGGLLLPYLTANVRFMVQKDTNALIVPNAALRWSPSSPAQIAPEERGGDATKQSKSAEERHGTLWVKEGDFVRAVEVKVGASDGSDTAVSGDGLQAGHEVVTGEIVGKAETGTLNPFLPRVIKRH